MISPYVARTKKAILKTLAYSAIFNFPLTKEEIWQRLITPKRIKQEEVYEQLGFLLSQGLVVKKNNFFYLQGLKKLKNRFKNKIFLRKSKKAEKIANFLRFLPWVKLVAATGGLGAGNITKDDDIDLMIITSPKRLWLSRLVIYFGILTLGKFFKIYLRRYNDREVKDKICLNLFLTTNYLKIPLSCRNLFTAYQLMFLKPLVDKNNLYYLLLAKNYFWLKRYLANWMADFPQKAFREPRFKNFILFDLLEKIAFWGQKKYMSSRITRERIDQGFAFFHPIDKGQEYLTDYRQQLKKVNYLKQTTKIFKPRL